jgi:GNAT superfamily N-acetyltransferase
MATADLDAKSAETLLAKVNAAHPTAPHWYLQLLMVDAGFQRRGIGTELLQPGLAAADREGVICVLETQARRNLAFYHRTGFVITAESSDESGTATMWTMVRQPR